MIATNSVIISNDIFRDHIFDMFKLFESKDNKIKNYISENIISYNKNNISSEKNYSKCIQVISNNVYIPTKMVFLSFDHFRIDSSTFHFTRTTTASSFR